MWAGYLAVGGLEVGNSARAIGYSRTSDCPTYWLKETSSCDSLGEALGHPVYDYVDIQNAPWYDPDIPDQSSRFLGVYIAAMENVQDSTREAAVTQRLQDGGRIGRIRRATREIRVRAVLTAKGEDAMEFGMSWLDSVLSPGACGAHGSACGVTDMEFFSECPPTRGTKITDDLLPDSDLYPEDDLFPAESVEVPLTDEEYAEVIDSYRRFFHNVACTSGPFTVEEFKSSDDVHVGRVVEFAITCENPWMYGVSTQVDVPPLVPSIVQDIAFNLLTRPSAELPGNGLTVSTNYCPNPSVETNATGYAYVMDPVSSPDPTSIVTVGRSNELAAVGSWAYRAHLDANGYANGWGGTWSFDVTTPLATPPTTSGTRISFSTWAAMILQAGDGNLLTMEAYGVFTGAGIEVPLTPVGGATDFNGTVFSASHILIPPGATGARVRVRFGLNWLSNDPGPGFVATVASAFVDAVAVTRP